MPHKDPEAKKAYQRAYYERHRDRLREQHKAYVQEHREELKQASRIRYRSNYPASRAARQKYAKSERGKLTQRVVGSKWSKANPEKKRAYASVRHALKSGRLVKQPCEVCGTTKNVHAHHDDYSRRLDVRWLCVAHHEQVHHGDNAEVVNAA